MSYQIKSPYMRKVLILSPLILIMLFSCSKTEDSTTPPPPPPPSTGTPLADKKDVQYGIAPDTAGNMVALNLDIYYPPGATNDKKYPLVVLIHGGGFTGGDKGGLEQECQILSDSGFIAVSINYRLGWRKGGSCNGDTADLNRAMYRALQDAHAALRYLISKSTEFAIDANWVFIGGSSAGGATALNTTYISQSVGLQSFPGLSASLGPVNTSGNNLTTTFSIKGVCNMWGALKDSFLINNGNAVPQISFHGMQDNVVPYDFGRFQNCPNYIKLCGSLSLHRQLLGYNKASIVHLSATGGHDPTEYSESFLMSNTACFFKRIMQGKTITSSVLFGVTNSCP